MDKAGSGWGATISQRKLQATAILGLLDGLHGLPGSALYVSSVNMFAGLSTVIIDFTGVLI